MDCFSFARRLWRLAPRAGRCGGLGPRAVLFWAGGTLVLGQAPVDVLTWHNDLARTGQNLRETRLTLDNVNTNRFGKVFSYAVDGFVYAQPLCLAGVTVPGEGLRNLVFVATEHDSVYAFDADDGTRDGGRPVWHARFTDPSAGITSVPTSDVGITEPSELGITGTPVIDPASGTLYVVTHTRESVGGVVTYPQRLHALDVASGQEKFGGPVVIQASCPGTGSNGNGTGQVVFDPKYDFQRPGLALANGMVYAAFASAGDLGPYHGWVLGFDARTLKLAQVFNDTPNGTEGGIWMSGAAPGVDREGNLYCMTGNGSFDAAESNFGDSFLKLAPTGTNLVVADYFTPFDQATLSAEDGDLGSGGPMLLPDSAGSPAHPHLLVGCGKEGTIYLLDRDHLGQFNSFDDSQVVQTLPSVIHGTWGNPAYFNGWIYYQGASDALKAFSIGGARLSTVPVSQNAQSVWNYPGGTPSISANGTNNAIVWLIQTDTFYQQAPAVLHAYNATHLEQELYNSEQAGTRDRPGLAQKFAVPVIANGKVYVPCGSLLVVYANLDPPLITEEPRSQAAIPGATAILQALASGTPPLSYQWRFGGTDLPGETSPTLVLSNLVSDQSGRYTVKVSNPWGTATSGEAELLVVEAPTLSIGADLQMVLAGSAGITYQVESLDAMRSTSGWQPLLELTLPAEGSAGGPAEATFADPTGPGDQRFYRATVLPQMPEGPLPPP